MDFPVGNGHWQFRWLPLDQSSLPLVAAASCRKILPVGVSCARASSTGQDTVLAVLSTNCLTMGTYRNVFDSEFAADAIKKNQISHDMAGIITIAQTRQPTKLLIPARCAVCFLASAVWLWASINIVVLADCFCGFDQTIEIPHSGHCAGLSWRTALHLRHLSVLVLPKAVRQYGQSSLSVGILQLHQGHFIISIMLFYFL